MTTTTKRTRAGARTALRLTMAVAIAMATTALVRVVDPAPVEAASAKITICHRTHSTTNPYRRITVSQSAVQPGRHGGHDLPNGSTNPPVFDPNFTYAPNNKYWGDVIPGSTDGGSAYNGTNSIALNWTVEGRAIFFGPLCQAMTAKQFYDVEIAAGVSPSDVIDDLNDQQANEDVALRSALGGSFSTTNVSSWEATISVVTDPASSVAESSAQLNGTLTVASTPIPPATRRRRIGSKSSLRCCPRG